MDRNDQTDSGDIPAGSDRPISRREFLRRAARLTGGLTAAASLLPALGCDPDLTPTPGVDAPTPQPAAPTEPPTLAPSPTAEPPPTEPPTPAPSSTTPPSSSTEPPTPASSPTTTAPSPTEPPPTPEVAPPASPPPAAGGTPREFSTLDLTANPYSAQRSVTVARQGVVAASQPLAVQAGLDALRRGGNAVDAALAAAITLTVVEPTANGLGADAFALIWDGGKLWGLNGSGRAPQAEALALLRARGYTTMPQKGWPSVTVPGAPALWRDLHARFGKLPFADLCQPAIDYAQHGYTLTPNVALDWADDLPVFAALHGPEYAGWGPMFAPHGRAPRAGEQWASPDLAASLRRIAASQADDFYQGDLAQALTQFAAQTGGLITAADLAAHTSTWVEPLATTYRGYTAWEMPPNTQGITTLIGLNILAGFDLGTLPRDSAASFHLQIEALKLAFADAFRYVADPAFAPVPTAGLLDPAYAARRRALIGKRALQPAPGEPNAGGTVYLCTADAGGMMVSFIQSNYGGFGSGIVVPGTGIALHNRGANFTLDPNHPNRLAPGKRPYHTIIPGFLTRAGQAIGPYGVMGGFMQPQGHLQMMVNTLDYGLNPQASLDAPRWQWVSGKTVAIESNVAPGIIRSLRAMGHDAQPQAPGGIFGRGQIIWRLPTGEYVAGSDRRADGYAGGI